MRNNNIFGRIHSKRPKLIIIPHFIIPIQSNHQYYNHIINKMLNHTLIYFYEPFFLKDKNFQKEITDGHYNNLNFDILINELIKDLKKNKIKQPFIILSQGIGTMMSLLFINKYPNYIRGCIFIDCFYFNNKPYEIKNNYYIELTDKNKKIKKLKDKLFIDLTKIFLNDENKNLLLENINNKLFILKNIHTHIINNINDYNIFKNDELDNQINMILNYSKKNNIINYNNFNEDMDDMLKIIYKCFKLFKNS